MTYAVRYAERARVQFADFVDWFFHHNPDKEPSDLIAQINEAFTLARRNPYLYQVDELPISVSSDIRHVTVWKFHFYYAISESEKVIEVTSIIHEATGPLTVERSFE